MSRTLMISAAVDGSNSLVALELVGHDHKIAATLGHAPGTGRWIDQYEVIRYADSRQSLSDGKPLVERHRASGLTLAQARAVASELYRDACARVAAHRWAQAEADSPHFHPDQDINGR